MPIYNIIHLQSGHNDNYIPGNGTWLKKSLLCTLFVIILFALLYFIFGQSMLFMLIESKESKENVFESSPIWTIVRKEFEFYF